MADAEITVPTRTPPRWMNSVVATMLRTPGLQRWLGGRTALITFTGAKSGNRYTTPVTYYRRGDRVTVVTKRFRSWWRNFAAHPDVELRLAGTVVSGRAVATVGDVGTEPLLIEFLENRPRDARAYGVTIGDDGALDEGAARSLLSEVVLVTVTLDAD